MEENWTRKDLGTERINVFVGAALLAGQVALGRRIGGRFGHWLTAVATRLRAEETPAPLRIPFEPDPGSA